MQRSLLTSKINFYVSVVFIVSFGLLATSTMLRVSSIDEDPITNTVTASITGSADQE